MHGQYEFLVLGLAVRWGDRGGQLRSNWHIAMYIASPLAIRGAKEISSDRDRVGVCALGIDASQGPCDTHECELGEILRLVRREPPLEEPHERGPQRCQQT